MQSLTHNHTNTLTNLSINLVLTFCQFYREFQSNQFSSFQSVSLSVFNPQTGAARQRQRPRSQSVRINSIWRDGKLKCVKVVCREEFNVICGRTQGIFTFHQLQFSTTRRAMTYALFSLTQKQQHRHLRIREMSRRKLKQRESGKIPSSVRQRQCAFSTFCGEFGTREESQTFAVWFFRFLAECMKH